MSFFSKRGKEEAWAMPQEKDTHEAWKSKGTGYKVKKVFENQETSASYIDSLHFDARFYSKVGFQIKNKHASNTIYWKILGCFDPKMGWEEILAETLVSANSTPPIEWTQKPFTWFKIQVKSGSGSGLVDAFIGGKTP